MFEVVHEKVGRTAWAGESAELTDLLRGPSAQGLDEACVYALDSQRVEAVLRWIDGKRCDGQSDASVPALFGLSLTAVSEAQRSPGMGYIDALGTPSAGLATAFASVDGDVARIVQELKLRRLYDSTWIFVTSAYGQSPMDRRQRRQIPLARLRAVADALQPGLVLHLSGGDVAMIWLRDPVRAAAVAKAYSDQARELGIQTVLTGQALTLTLNAPAKDSRMPDIVLEPKPGVIWSLPGDPALASFGGPADEDTHVALLVSGAQLTGRFDPTPVPITQLAPLLLRSLGMEKFDLKALHLEHSPALPGIF
jgi:hypothetical protein